MRRFDRVLVGDSSRVVRHLLERFLALRARRVELFADGAALKAALRTPHPPDLVVADTQLPYLDGLGLLAEVRSLEGARPAVVLLSAHPSRDEETRASLADAIGYLGKPIRLDDLAGVLGLDDGCGPRRRTPASTARPVGVACLVDDGRRVVACDVLALSETGAWVATHAPFPADAALDLDLFLGNERIRVAARVVRSREPRGRGLGPDRRVRSTWKRDPAGHPTPPGRDREPDEGWGAFGGGLVRLLRGRRPSSRPVG